MAGTDPTGVFDAAAFRAGIRQAMRMGSPNVTADRATFMFPEGRTFAVADNDGNPYDWDLTPSGGLPAATPVVLQEVAIQTKAAVGARGQPRTSVGEFDEDSATLYLFEDEWAQVSTFTTVKLGGSVYERVKRLIPLGLFEVQIEQIHVRAVDEA